MSSDAAALPSDCAGMESERMRHALQRGLVCIVGLLALAISWPIFVFSGSQVAYVASMGAVALSVTDLVLRRSRMIIAYLAFLVSVIGPDVGGSLGSGTPPFGSLRLIDFTIAVGSCVLGASTLSELWDRPQRLPDAKAIARWVTSHWIVVGCGALACYALLRWMLLGPSINPLVKADVRLGALILGTFVLATACSRGKVQTALIFMCAIGPILALKAEGIHLSHLWAIGANDRLQASTTSASTVRVVLDGGDTLLTIIPALAFLCFDRASSPAKRGLLIVCAASALAGLLASGTRTSLIVALALSAFVIVGLAFTYGAGTRRRWLAVLAVVSATAVFGVVASGDASRFTTPDAPHVGINFRKDEVDSFFRLPDHLLLLGQGLGGHFVGKDVNGQLVTSGWMHELPLWIVLKVGYVGFAAVLVLTVAFLIQSLRAIRDADDHFVFDAGLVIMLGVTLLSFTLNRAALPEGAILLSIAVALIRDSVTPGIDW